MTDWKKQAAALMARMTDGEKASLLSGADFWHTRGVRGVGLPAVMLTDGPHGLRKQVGAADHVGLNDSVPATCFPAECATGCAFDPELLYELGRAMGEECRREDVAGLLGPGVNHKRSPQCGRSFEYFSEDPYLTGKTAAGLIRGLQSTGVAASLKHLACNSQERNRQTSDSVVDERALRELYLRQFEIAVREGQPWTVMTSYNRINGVYAASDAGLMQDIVRGEWGFEGLFVTDWGGMSDTVTGIAAGTDLEMPGVCTGGDKLLLSALADGRLPRARFEDAARRVTELVLRYQAARETPCPCDLEAHGALAERAARESAVLLKNDGALPLRPGKSLALLGGFARTPRVQGSGSSRIHPMSPDSLAQALDARGIPYDYSEAFGPEETFPDEKKLSPAVALAAQRDAAVIVCGLPSSFESEGFDRESLWMPECQMELIRRVSAVNKNTVVVLQCGGVVEMPWVDQPNAILLQYLAGERGGGACADLLLGRANPCGKLAETWPLTLDDTPCRPWYRKEPYAALYGEGLHSGYRYYDAVQKPVRYPFGHGLSYTTFAYSDLSLTPEGARFTLENTGAVAGKEAAQVYIIKNGHKQLKGFLKVELAPGQKKTLTVPLDDHAFDYWNTDEHAWRQEGGDYTLWVGSSSRDLRLTLPVTLPEGTAPPAYLAPGEMPSPARFAALPGVRVPGPRATRPFTPDSPVQDLQETVLGRLFVTALRRAVGGSLGGEDVDRMVELTVLEMPLRFMGMSGFFTKQQVNGVVDFFNGRRAAGIRQLLRDFAEQR